MRPSAIYQASVDILSEVLLFTAPTDRIFTAYVRSRRYIGSKDRRMLQHLLYQILRHYAHILWWIHHLELQETPRCFLLVYLILYEKKSIAELTPHFGEARFSLSALTPSEIRALTTLIDQDPDHPDQDDMTRFEVPAWAWEAMAQDPHREEVFAALQQRAAFDLRVNPAQTDVRTLCQDLQKQNISSTPFSLTPYTLRAAEHFPVGSDPHFIQGAYEVQDAGSQLLAFLTGCQAGEQVVDYCAGAGGKSLVMAAMMAGKGRVLACDVMESRLARTAKRAKRAGVHNIETRLLSAENRRWQKRQYGRYDRVFVDAPCSGVGAWRRNPDSRWRKIDLEKLQNEQLDILAQACLWVKPGGWLFYGTCSLLPFENQDVVKKFLQHHDGFHLVSLRPVAKTISDAALNAITEEGFLSLAPHRNDCDGFFMAALQKQN